MGKSHDEFAELVEGVAPRDEVAAIELNVSCPNVESGLIVGEQPAETLSLLEAAAAADRQAADRQADAERRRPGRGRSARPSREEPTRVSLINTLKATAIDPATLRPWLGAGSGGLSGPAVRAIALHQVRRRRGCRSRCRSSGMGGIESGADALAFLAAGASAVAVGTASFRDPLAARADPRRVGRGIAAAPKSPP